MRSPSLPVEFEQSFLLGLLLKGIQKPKTAHETIRKST